MGDALAVIDGFLAEGSTQVATAGAAETLPATAHTQVVEVPGSESTPAPKSKGGLQVIQGGLGKIPEVKDLPTPSGKMGSLAILLLLIIFIMFAVVQAPGQNITRLQLLWKSIMGNTDLDSSDPGQQYASEFEMPAWAMQGGW